MVIHIDLVLNMVNKPNLSTLEEKSSSLVSIHDIGDDGMNGREEFREDKIRTLADIQKERGSK